MAVAVTAYTKQTWQDYTPSYPVSATRMGHIEDGVYSAQGTADAALALAQNQSPAVVPVNVSVPTIS